MAIQVNEAWVSSSGAIVAVRKKGGGYLYFVNAKVTVNGVPASDNPLVAREISAINLEIMEAKSQ